MRRERPPVFTGHPRSWQPIDFDQEFSRPPRDQVYAYGVTQSNTSRLKTALNRVIGGTGDALWLDIGDSTTAGTGSDSLAGNGLRAQSRPTAEASKIATRLGITVVDESVFGGIGKTTANYALYNPKVTIGSATLAGTNVGPGGPLWNHALTTGPMRFTPSAAFDRVRVRWKGNTTGRNIVWTTSTTETGSLVGDSSFAIKTTVLSVTSATWIEFKASTAATVEWIGFETYNNSGSKLFLNNVGWGGSTAADWVQATGGGTRPLLAIPHMAPDFGLINLNINDMFAGTSISTWKSNVQQIIDAVKQSGDCALMTSNPLNTTKYGSEASQAPFFQAVRDLAAANNIPCIDLKTQMVDWATANSNNYMSDNEHMLAAGYTYAATFVDDFVRVVMAA